MSDDQQRDDHGHQPEAGTDSRVEDWMGQSVQHDEELIDELAEQGFDDDEIESELEERDTGKDEQERRHGDSIDPDQGRSAYADDAEGVRKPADDPESPGATIDDPAPAEPNEPA